MEQAATPPTASPATQAPMTASDDNPISAPTTDEFDAAHATIRATIERLEGLGLNNEGGRAVVEPASVFHWQ